jgi:hypothetical protein
LSAAKWFTCPAEKGLVLCKPPIRSKPNTGHFGQTGMRGFRRVSFILSKRDSSRVYPSKRAL